MSSLANYYDNKVLFITGCTGFLGKVLLEKYLRCFPRIGQIFLMIRPKKGSSLMERFKREIVDSQCFDGLRNLLGQGFEKFIESKITLVEGDMLKDNLGLNPDDLRAIKERVQVIINCAASVDFNARLDDALMINVRGPQRIFKVAKEVRHLENFVHISTAYVNSDKQGWIEEKIYDPDMENLEELVTNLLKTPVSILEKNTKEILGDFPNSYTFSKSIAERLLAQNRPAGFPMTIIRPSIIGASWKDPLPGWIDSLLASAAIYFFVGLGLIHTMHCDEYLIGDQVPVDFVTDYIMTGAAYQANKNELSVYHCSSSARNPMTWNLAKQCVLSYWGKNPSSQQFAKPNITFYKHYSMYSMMAKVKNSPAMMYYHIAQQLGSKTMKIQGKRLKKMIDRAGQINDTFKCFMNNEWIFDSGKTQQLNSFLTSVDKQLVNLDIEQLDWRKYMDYFNWGIQKFILKENVSAISMSSPDLLNNRNKQSYFSDIEWCMNQGQYFKTKSNSQYISLVMNSQRVQAVIKQLVEEKAKKLQNTTLNLEKIHLLYEQEGQDICKQMFADYNMSIIRIFGWFMTKVFRQIYEKVQINESMLEQIQNYNQKDNGPLILMPTHRSYIDFLMCSYVFFAYKIKCPHIAAAEDFLSMAMVPFFLRASGAFFLRRKSLEDNILYKTIFYEYVQRVLTDECYLEFFIEGTRSRTGKTLNPKFGLLGIVADAVYDGKIPDATILPITINYEKVLEADTYPYELLGEEKVKESLIRVMKAAKILQFNYGQIQIQFGKMISVKKWAQERNLDAPNNTLDRRRAVESLGYEVAYRLVEDIVVMPTGVVSALLLMTRRGTTEEQLIKRYEWLSKQVSRRNGKISIVSAEVAVRNSINLLIDLVDKKKRNVFDVHFIPKADYKSVLLLSYYRNQLAHIFFQEGIMCCALSGFGHMLSHKEGVPIKRLWEESEFLFKLFKKEYVIRYRVTGFQDMEQLIQTMVQRGVLGITDQQVVRVDPSYGEQSSQFMCSIIWPLVETYWATLVYIYSLQRMNKSIELNKLVTQVQGFAEQMFEEHIMEHYESCSIETIKNAMSIYQSMNFIKIQKDTNQEIVTVLSTEEKLLEVEAQLKKFLKNNFAKSIQNPIDIAKKTLDYTILPKM